MLSEKFSILYFQFQLHYWNVLKLIQSTRLRIFRIAHWMVKFHHSDTGLYIRRLKFVTPLHFHRTVNESLSIKSRSHLQLAEHPFTRVIASALTNNNAVCCASAFRFRGHPHSFREKRSNDYILTKWYCTKILSR